MVNQSYLMCQKVALNLYNIQMRNRTNLGCENRHNNGVKYFLMFILCKINKNVHKLMTSFCIYISKTNFATVCRFSCQPPFKCHI